MRRRRGYLKPFKLLEAAQPVFYREKPADVFKQWTGRGRSYLYYLFRWFYQLRGYSIYYERNQMMQDYMIARKDILREESKTDDRAIRDFRKKMDEHKTAAVRQRSAVSVLSGLCSVLAVMVLAGGVAMFNNYKRLHEMEQVVASVDPEAVIREARGNLSSVAGNRTTGETPVEVIPETMAPGDLLQGQWKLL